MAAILLRHAQTYPLAHDREVVTSATVSEPVAIAGDEERLRRKAEQTVALDGIGSQAACDAVGDRDQPLLAQLATTDAQHTFVQIDIIGVETDRFADPQASRRDQPKQRRTGVAPQSLDRPQLGGSIDDRG